MTLEVSASASSTGFAMIADSIVLCRDRRSRSIRGHVRSRSAVEAVSEENQAVPPNFRAIRRAEGASHHWTL